MMFQREEIVFLIIYHDHHSACTGELERHKMVLIHSLQFAVIIHSHAQRVLAKLDDTFAHSGRAGMIVCETMVFSTFWQNLHLLMEFGRR
jgi:hypothetical protein